MAIQTDGAQTAAAKWRRLMMPYLGLPAAVVCALILAHADGWAQQGSAPDPLERLGFTIGKWEGTGEGKPGKSTVRRENSRALRSRFIRAVPLER